MALHAGRSKSSADPVVTATAEGRIVELREKVEEARDQAAKLRPIFDSGPPAAVLGDIEEQLVEAKRQIGILSEAVGS